ncbi:MAG: ABC transporter permease [Acidobacteriia bacterium]|nr:ABC transporter permease [Terriglobia bacterium]
MGASCTVFSVLNVLLLHPPPFPEPERLVWLANARYQRLLSHGLWERRFASDPAIAGRALIINDEPHTVAGVLPATFDFASVFAPGSHFDLFFPLPLTAETNRWGNTLAIIGRLNPGVAIGAAQARPPCGRRKPPPHIRSATPPKEPEPARRARQRAHPPRPGRARSPAVAGVPRDTHRVAGPAPPPPATAAPVVSSVAAGCCETDPAGVANGGWARE